MTTCIHCANAATYTSPNPYCDEHWAQWFGGFDPLDPVEPPSPEMYQEALEKMPFCDFCSCDTCRDGAHYLSHAQTTDGRWICDVCYEYECCLNAGFQPCEEECNHRPQLKTGWTRGKITSATNKTPFLLRAKMVLFDLLHSKTFRMWFPRVILLVFVVGGALVVLFNR